MAQRRSTGRRIWLLAILALLSMTAGLTGTRASATSAPRVTAKNTAPVKPIAPARVATAGSAPVTAAARSNSLSVRVVGLPHGVPASVLVTGPHYRRVLTRSSVLRALPRGRYTITTKAVHLTRAVKSAQAGSVALPSGVARHLVLGQRTEGRVTATYGTIINARVVVFNGQVRQVVGDLSNPNAIVVTRLGSIKAGSLLAARPNSHLPAGLFHIVNRIVTVRHPHGPATYSLRLRPAHLTDAFPELDLHSALHLKTSMSAASPHLDAPVASLGFGNYRCSEPANQTNIQETESFNLDGDVDVEIPTFYGIPDGLPYGKIYLTASGSAGIEADLEKNLGCSASQNLPPFMTVIPVGPVPVPVYVQGGVFGSLSVGAKGVHAGASASFSATGGMSFDGFNVTNLSTATGNATAHFDASGKVAFGLSLRLAVGVAKVADVHLDIKPSIALTGDTTGGCSVDAVGGSQVGISAGPFQLNQSLPAPSINLYKCPTPPTPTPPTPTPPTPTPPTPTPPTPSPPAPAALTVQHSGPLGAFPNQTFAYTVRVTNSGGSDATNVTVDDTLPTEGSLVGSTPAGTASDQGDGTHLSLSLGTIPAGQTAVATVQWKAPSGASPDNSVIITGDGLQPQGPYDADVPVGTNVSCSPCGAVSAGTGLRNRDHGSVTISGIPAGATVGRAVLVWAILYNGSTPANTITFAGQQVSADLTQSVSGNLCWSDTATIGYAADVTSLVSGNGTYDITDPPRGVTQVDDNPAGALPYTDGASLVVFYDGGGSDSQVLSDFSYDTNTDADGVIDRSFGGVKSVGGPASITLAGPDGQSDYGDDISVTGSSSLDLADSWDGSAPQDGPSFPIGSLWDNDTTDVSSIVPAGQTTFSVHAVGTGATQYSDCIGISAAVLQVSQKPSP